MAQETQKRALYQPRGLGWEVRYYSYFREKEGAVQRLNFSKVTQSANGRTRIGTWVFVILSTVYHCL